MIYFQVNTRPRKDAGLCFLTDVPEGTDDFSYKMKRGELVGERYPEDARVFMARAEKGIKLADLVGNTRSLLIVSRRMKEVIEKAKQEQVEYLPLSIYDHKKKLASADYFIVNPIGTYDCLDLEASDITWSDDKVVGVDECVLSAKKLEGAPDIFRVREDPGRYILGEDLVVEMQKIRPENVFLIELKEA